LELYEVDCDQAFTDVDLVYFVDHELVIGEVKSDPSAFAAEDLDTLETVASDLLPDRVVLAAPGDRWPAEVLDRVRVLSEQQAESGVRWEIVKLSQTVLGLPETGLEHPTGENPRGA